MNANTNTLSHEFKKVWSRTSRKQWSILNPDEISKMCRHVCGLQKKDTHKELNICTTCSQVSLSTHHCLRCSIITINIEKLSAWLETGWFIFFWYVDNLADLGETNYIWHERIGIWKKQKEKFFEQSQIKTLDKTDDKPIAVPSGKMNK